MTTVDALLVLWVFQSSYMLSCIALAARSARRRRAVTNQTMDTSAETPAVTILVPAYNEAKTIVECLTSIRRSSLQAAFIIVVDDGSKDATAELASMTLNGIECARIIRNPSNLGKARSLTVALAEVRTELVFCLDADTRLTTNTLEHAVTLLQRDELDALACRVTIDRPHSLLAAFQAVEYEASLQLDRLAQAELDVVTTVPGAGGLYRTLAVRMAGGFRSRSLAEDTDLTLSIQRRRGRIGTAIDAVVQTEPPHDFGSLLRQRERWVWGNLGAMGWHIVTQEQASMRFTVLTLPLVLFNNGILPLLYVGLLVLTPQAALGGDLLLAFLGSLLTISLAIAKARVAYAIGQSRPPGIPMLLASLLVLPLVTTWATFFGLIRRIFGVGGRRW